MSGITITLAPSEAHLLLAVLDEARKGQPFPLAAYGLAGEAQIVGMFSRVSEAIRATRNPPVAELVDVDQADDEDVTDVAAIMSRLTYDPGDHDWDLGEGFAEAPVSVSLDGAELCRSRVCWSVGWLEAGAHADLDGSGLALWGDSQPGGWRTVLRGAGVDNADGRAELADEIHKALVARGLLPEGDRLEVAAMRGEILRVIVATWDFEAPDTPGADDVWDALEDRRSTDRDEWRVGVLCRRRTPLLAWRDEEGQLAFTSSPSEYEIDRAARCARARIKAALAALEEVAP